MYIDSSPPCVVVVVVWSPHREAPRHGVHHGIILVAFYIYFHVFSTLFFVSIFIDFLVGNGRFLNGRTDGSTSRTDGSTRTVAVERSVLPEWSVPER